jgi:hypothetical protein
MEFNKAIDGLPQIVENSHRDFPSDYHVDLSPHQRHRGGGVKTLFRFVLDISQLVILHPGCRFLGHGYHRQHHGESFLPLGRLDQVVLSSKKTKTGRRVPFFCSWISLLMRNSRKNA